MALLRVKTTAGRVEGRFRAEMVAPGLPVRPSLPDVARYYLDRTPDQQKTQFLEAVAQATAEGRPVRVGTACSGTDSPVAVFTALAASLPGLQIEHTFSCEYHKGKREWIRDNFPRLPALFGDIGELGTGRAFDYITGQARPVPAVDIFVTGFVCKSISSQNNSRGQFANCIREASGLTGVTFQGTLNYVKAFRPAIVILENVNGLTKKARGKGPVIAHIRELFASTGYAFEHKVLDTRRYLLPHRRQRCWMWAFRGQENQYAAELAGTTIVKLGQARFWKMASLFRQVHARPDSRKAKQVLTSRQRRVLALVKQHKAKHKGLVVDVGQGEDRGGSFCSGGAAPCLLPNSKLYHADRKQVLGVEQVLALQGIFRKDFPALPAWAAARRTLARDMAGNAFSTTTCMAVVLAALIHGPLLCTACVPRIADESSSDGSPVVKRARREE